MNEPVDLLPSEWKSEREKPREPFFGSGLPLFIGVCISIVLATIAHEAGYGPIAKGGAMILGAVIGSAIYQLRG